MPPQRRVHKRHCNFLLALSLLNHLVRGKPAPITRKFKKPYEEAHVVRNRGLQPIVMWPFLKARSFSFSQAFKWPQPWLKVLLQLHERPWPRNTQQTNPKFLIHRNCGIINTCFKLLNFQHNWSCSHRQYSNQSITTDIHSSCWLFWLLSCCPVDSCCFTVNSYF